MNITIKIQKDKKPRIYQHHSLEKLYDIFKEMGERHSSYKHYAPEYKIDNIINKGYIYLSDGHNWNDPVDKHKMTKNSFAICFSCSSFESVAMWMLYGGIDKKGALIDFNQNMMKNLCHLSQEISFGHFNGNEFVTAELSDDDFKKNPDINLVDIGYIEHKEDKENKSTIIKVSDKYTVTIDEILDNLQYTKNPAWDYEKECRLIVSTYPKNPDLFESKNVDTLRIKLDEKDLKKLQERIYLSPVHPNKYDRRSRKYIPRPSQLSGKVDWDLCPHECKYKNS